MRCSTSPTPSRCDPGSGSPTTTSTPSPPGCGSPGCGGDSTNGTAAPYGLDQFLQNTWRFGIDRVLSGVAMSDDSRAWIGTTLPLDDVGSNRVELAGRLAEFVDRLAGVVDALSGVRPLADWLDALRDGVTNLTRADGDDAWQGRQLDP